MPRAASFVPGLVEHVPVFRRVRFEPVDRPGFDPSLRSDTTNASAGDGDGQSWVDGCSVSVMNLAHVVRGYPNGQ